MEASNANFVVLQEACISLARGFNDFWVLAGLTDRSYEDGVSKAGFPKSVDAYRGVGLNGEILRRLENGVNGNLLDLLRLRNDIHSVVRRTGKGQDLTFTHCSGRTAAVEVKLLFDCTLLKHYATTAEDWDKLLKVRATAKVDDLFLVVFFQQMPYYDYAARSKELRHCGIQEQFVELKRHLHHEPAWPETGPYVHELSVPSSEIEDLLVKRWPPRQGWKLDLAKFLRRSSVGAAIWAIS